MSESENDEKSQEQHRTWSADEDVKIKQAYGKLTEHFADVLIVVHSRYATIKFMQTDQTWARGATTMMDERNSTFDSLCSSCDRPQEERE